MAMTVVQAAVWIAAGLILGVHFAAGPLGIVVLFFFSLLIGLGFGALGAFLALRTGSGEAVQGMFPVFFVFLFISSMAMPRNLIQIDWFRTAATLNPVSYLLEGDPQPDHRRLGPRGARARLRGRHRARLRRARACGDGLAHEDGALVRTLSVAQGVAWRVLHNVFTNPSLLIPSLVFPLFFFTAFAGGLVADLPRPRLRLPARVHGLPVRLRAPPVRGVRRRLHGLRHRARLRERLRPPAAARRAAPRLASSSATRRRRSCAGPSRSAS